MIPAQTYINNLMLSESAVDVSGVVVECGVWRGGMSAGLVSVFGKSRKYYLFDSFEGLPAAKDIDGAAALIWQQDKASSNYYNNCSADEIHATTVMTQAGAESFTLIKGWFSETLPSFELDEPIALLRLDGDWYESTIVCLENLFCRVSPGGIIIFDDYYAWDGCSRAVHDFLSKESAVERIQEYKGICYIKKA